MGRFNNVKVSTFSKKVNLTEMGSEFHLFDSMVTHREGNYVTVVSHEYYRPSYRTHFRRPGRKNKNYKEVKQEEEEEEEPTSTSSEDSKTCEQTSKNQD